MKSVGSRLLRLVHDPDAPRLGTVSVVRGAALGSLSALLIALAMASQGRALNNSLSISKFNFLPQLLTVCPYKPTPRSGLIREADRGRRTSRLAQSFLNIASLRVLKLLSLSDYHMQDG